MLIEWSGGALNTCCRLFSACFGKQNPRAGPTFGIRARLLVSLSGLLKVLVCSVVAVPTDLPHQKRFS